jgi:hypothetical protein
MGLLLLMGFRTLRFFFWSSASRAAHGFAML